MYPLFEYEIDWDDSEALKSDKVCDREVDKNCKEGWEE